MKYIDMMNKCGVGAKIANLIQFINPINKPDNGE